MSFENVFTRPHKYYGHFIALLDNKSDIGLSFSALTVAEIRNSSVQHVFKLNALLLYIG